MRRATVIAQVLFVTTLVALLAARLPSFAEHAPAAFSVRGCVVGVAISLVGFGFGKLLSPMADTAEQSGTRFQLWTLRGSLVALLGALTAFTAFAYLGLAWLKVVLALFILAGVVCVACFNLERLIGRSRDA